MTRDKVDQEVQKLVDKLEQASFDTDDLVEKLAWALEEIEISHQAAKEVRDGSAVAPDGSHGYGY